ncbi:hypothetical protein ABZ736_21675 [Streptomyces sp. NPDC013099]|uniref:hypothetical protein n=1 Tax=Streptomyces sp. NPDC013099 TaxID=3156687 RepID=UPI00340C116F
MPKAKSLYPRPDGCDPDELLQPHPGTARMVTLAEQEIADAKAVSSATFERWRDILGQARAPRLLYDCWTARQISRRTLRQHVGSIWHTSDIPDYWLTHDQWRELFSAAGYTHVVANLISARAMIGGYEQGIQDSPPRAPLTVYRGSIRARRDDWSWTASPAVAARWASGNQYGRPAGHVWVTTAPPENLLCRIDRWDQYVVDTAGLHITQHTEGV